MTNSGPIQGQPPSDNEKMWLDLGQNLAKGSIDAIEGMAKNLLTAIGVLEGLYFHAVSFEKVQDRTASIARWLGTDTWVVALLFGLPAVLWLLAAGSAMRALAVKRHDLYLDDPSSIEQGIQKIASDKYSWTRTSMVLLIIGLAVLSLNLIVYLSA